MIKISLLGFVSKVLLDGGCRCVGVSPRQEWILSNYQHKTKFRRRKCAEGEVLEKDNAIETTTILLCRRVGTHKQEEGTANTTIIII